MGKTIQQTVPAALALDVFGDDLRAAIQIASSSGFSSVALGVWHPQLNNPDFGATARRDLKRLLKSKNLSLACIRAGIGPGGLFDPNTVDSCTTVGLSAINLAADLGAKWTSLYIGEPPDISTKPSVIEAALHEHLINADVAGVSLAVSSGGVDFLSALLRKHSAENLAVNLDTLKILSTGRSIGDALKILAGHIGIWTCTDAVGSARAVRPAPLGSGTVPLHEIYDLLKQQDFTGPIVIDVRNLSNPLQAIIQAAEFMRKLLTI